MSELTQFMEDINALDVPMQLLGEVTILWASLPPAKWQDFDQKLQCVVDFVGKARGADDPLLAMAIALRLMALDAMVIDPEMRGWLITEKSPEGITYIHGDLLKVAAQQRILEGPEGQPVFDRSSFRAGLMEMVAARGSA